jgi:type I restriction enzyme, S subunit
MKTRGNPSGPEVVQDLITGRIYGRNCASGPADIETKNACKPEESIYGEVSDQLRGVSYAKADVVLEAQEGYLPVLRAGNITDSGLAFDDLVYVPTERISLKQRIRKGDVVIAASSGSLDVVGKAAMAHANFDAGFGAFCKVLRPNAAKVEPTHFAHYFQTREYRKKISSLAAGANINNLRNEHLDDLLIPLPPLPEQRRIAATLDKADALCAKRREALAQLDELTQSIFFEMFGDPATNPKGWLLSNLGELIHSASDGPHVTPSASR